jgi:hypothetical protein
MKKCPTCGKTFDDNLRFCQTDGTPLVDDAPAAEPVAEEPFDPYATIVGVPKGVVPSAEPMGEPLDVSPSGTVSLEPAAPAADAGEPGPSSSADAGSVAGESVSSIPVAPPDDILELGSDPLKTMYVSDTEMKEVLATSQGAETPSEEIRADEAQVEAPAGLTDFASMTPPPSPFSAPSSPDETPVPAPPSFLDSPRTPDSEARTQVQMESPFQPEPPAFQEAPTVFQSGAGTPQFSEPAPAPLQNQEWNPPPAPDPNWQGQQIGSNTPFQPPPGGAGTQSQGLAIASLCCGIASLICCSWFIVGLAAIILGFIARGKATKDPANYRGGGMALAAIIMGAASLLLGVIVWIFYGGLILSNLK